MQEDGQQKQQLLLDEQQINVIETHNSKKVPWHRNFILFTDEGRGILAIAGGFLIHLILGSLYLWGNINGYVASYFTYKTGHNITIGTVNAVFPFIFQSGGIAVCFTDFALKHFNAQRLCLFCSFIMSLSVCLSSFAPNFYVYVIFYGIFYGFFQGLILYPPIYNGYKYYPTQKGKVTGIIVCGFGFGNLVLSQIAQALINPDNIASQGKEHQYPKNVADRLPFSLQMLSLIYFCTLCVGCLLMRPPLEKQHDSAQQDTGNSRLNQTQQSAITEDEFKNSSAVEKQDTIHKNFIQSNDSDSFKADGSVLESTEQNIDNKTIAEVNQTQSETQGSFKQAFNQRITAILFLQAWAMTACGMLISSNYKPYQQQREGGLNSEVYLTTLGSLTSVANALGRPLFGALLDAFPFKYIAMFNFSCQLVIMATIHLVADSKAFYMIWVLLIFLFYGASYALIVPLTQKIYGEKTGKIIYRVIYQGFCLQSWTQFLIVAHTKSIIGYENIFYIYSGIAAFGLLLCFIANYNPIQWNKAKLAH